MTTLPPDEANNALILGHALHTGIEQGVKQGLQQGIQQGQAQAKLESAITAVKKYKASLEDVSKDFGVPLETLQEALKEA